MLEEAGEHVVKNIKAPLFEAIVLYGMMYPEPTHENVRHKNTHILLDIQDEFFKYYTNKRNIPLFKAAFKILIVEYDHDQHYGWILDWFLEMLVNSDWESRPMGHPNEAWTEPEPYGGGYLIKDETLKKNIRRFKSLCQKSGII